VATIALLTSAKQPGRVGPPSAWYEVGRNNYLAEELTRRGHRVRMWWDEPDGELLANVDLAVLRSGKATNIARARELEAQGVLVLNHPFEHDRASDKWLSANEFVARGISHPPTSLAEGPRDENEVVLKRRRGSGGHTVERVAGSQVPQSDDFIVQPLLDWTDDLRATVIDGKVVYTLRRRPKPGEWRTNLAQGASFVRAHEIPHEAERLAVAATAALGLGWGGVDLLDTEQGWIVLEVNPGTTLYGEHPDDGLFIVASLADYLEQQLAESGTK